MQKETLYSLALAMRILKEYFRRRPWQRRIAGGLLIIIVAGLTGRAVYPAYLWCQRREADLRLIDRLGAADGADREAAVQTAIVLSQRREELVNRLAEALNTPSDRRFLAIHFVLRRLGRWDVLDRGPRWTDRYRLLELRETYAPQPANDPAAGVRERLVREFVLCGRDNRYVRQALNVAAEDPAASVRIPAATLAGRLGDDDVLTRLFQDSAARVVAAAVLDAGIAGRTSLAGRIEAMLHPPAGPPNPAPSAEAVKARREILSSAAYALAGLDAKKYSKRLCASALTADETELQDRLLVALLAVNDERARQCGMDILHRYRWRGRRPSGMALWTAARMKLPDAAPIAMEVLRAAVRNEPDLRDAQIIGALEVISALRYPCRKEVYDICRTLWRLNRTPLLVRAARLLGQQATMRDPSAGAPNQEACKKLLQDAAQYSLRRGAKSIPTPLASASAAVALWTLAPAEGLHFLREAVAVEDTSAGNFVAWRLGCGDLSLPKISAVGRAFLPSPGEKPGEYNPAVRATGAMLLALSARTDQQRRAAVARIAARMDREEFLTRASMQCALLIAGQRERRDEVGRLLTIPEFPPARAMMALLTAGDRKTLDETLWNLHEDVSIPLSDLPVLLIDRDFAAVLAETAPALPLPSPAGSEATQHWQAKILRDTYGIRRERISVGLSR